MVARVVNKTHVAPDYDRTMIVASASIRTICIYRQHNLHNKCLSGGLRPET
jgi:hypothetical protein